ncbi:hypothetical protein MKX03_023100 [Papaver bracteatum]|nr:hypothetical protein MKX03_006537 [Papaver bracteatum]KAI3880575.1 hypothetical protein MKX03_023100 [Papaver bracteatum]
MASCEDIKKQRSSSSSFKKNKKKCSSCCCCCNCRYRATSLDDSSYCHSTDSNEPIASTSSHTMVQERLDQMIRDRSMRIGDKLKNEGLRKKRRSKERLNIYSTKSIVMVALDKYSYDPREDFRESMIECD